MEHDEEWLKALVARRTREIWDTQKRPYYISYIAVDAAQGGADYKKLIAPLKLRQWAITSEIDGLKAVAHPIHKAKVGFIPADENYEFEDTSEAGPIVEDNRLTSRPSVKTRRPTLQFLEALSSLSDSELDGVNIPLRTIVRLLHG